MLYFQTGYNYNNFILIDLRETNMQSLYDSFKLKVQIKDK